jgi:hypothetical protein
MRGFGVVRKYYVCNGTERKEVANGGLEKKKLTLRTLRCAEKRKSSPQRAQRTAEVKRRRAEKTASI